MTNWYVDVDSPNYDSTELGTTADPFLGPAGLYNAVNGVGAGGPAAGDTIYVKGTTGRLDRLAKLTYANGSAAEDWAVGDVVRNYNTGGGSPGDDWVGCVFKNDPTANVLYVTISSGDTGYYADIANADGVENVTQSENVATVTKATCPIEMFTNIGTIGARLTIIGCKDDASWTVDGTQCVLDGNDVVTNCVSTNGTGDYWTLANFELSQAATSGLYAGTNKCAACILENVYAHDCGDLGIDATYVTPGLLVRCLAENNVSGGIKAYYTVTLIACVALHNTAGYGFSAGGSGNVSLVDCLAHGNLDNLTATSTGIVTAVNCVFDGAGRHGVSLTEAAAVFLDACRITNNGNATNEFGLNMGAAGAYAYLRHCMFVGNQGDGDDAAHDIGGTGADNVVQLDVAASASPNTNILKDNTDPIVDGYVDSSAHDFNIDPETTELRNVADVLPEA